MDSSTIGIVTSAAVALDPTLWCWLGPAAVLTMLGELTGLFAANPQPKLTIYLQETYRHGFGYDPLIGKEALVTRDLVPFHQTGQSVVDGEKWRTICDEWIAKDDKVQIVAIIGSSLYVRRIE